MTKEDRVQVKLNFIHAHLVNEVAKYIKVHTKSSFFTKTGFKEKDLQEMINLEYEWDLSTLATLSVLVGFDVLLIGKIDRND